METVKTALARMREEVLSLAANGASPADVADYYEQVILTRLERVEHRLVTEIYGLDGWQPYHHVPLSSREVGLLPSLQIAATQRQRPENPSIGDYGFSWLEIRLVTGWERETPLPRAERELSSGVALSR
jgi:hypothetical protein